MCRRGRRRPVERFRRCTLQADQVDDYRRAGVQWLSNPHWLNHADAVPDTRGTARENWRHRRRRLRCHRKASKDNGGEHASRHAATTPPPTASFQPARSNQSSLFHVTPEDVRGLGECSMCRRPRQSALMKSVGSAAHVVRTSCEVGASMARNASRRSASFDADLRDRRRDRTPDADRLMDSPISARTSITCCSGRRCIQPVHRRRGSESSHGHLGVKLARSIRDCMAPGRRDRAPRVRNAFSEPTRQAGRPRIGRLTTAPLGPVFRSLTVPDAAQR